MKDSDGDIRKRAVKALSEESFEKVLPAAVDLVSADADEKTVASCIQVAESFGAALSFLNLRKDGWFEELGKRTDNFELICQIVGKRYLAYSILLGIQIESLTRDRVSPANTVVEFKADGTGKQLLPLGQFQSQVAAALASVKDQSEIEPTLPLTENDAVSIIGDLSLLVAPLVGISLEQLLVCPSGEGLKAKIGYRDDKGVSYLPVEKFVQMIREVVKADISPVEPQRFQLNLETVTMAEKAAQKGDYDKVIELMKAWPGLLQTMLRTPSATRLSKVQIERITDGLRVLAKAYSEKGNLKWAIELYRLGIQYCGDTSPAGSLFLELGLLMNSNGRYGEAIGYLRRAMALDMDPETVYEALGRALMKTGRTVCAYLLLREAADISSEGSCQLFRDLEEAKKIISSANLDWPK